MAANDIAVLVVAVAVVVGLGWYFFGPRGPRAARLADGVQRVEVTVRGGYRPDRIRVRQGVPLGAGVGSTRHGGCRRRPRRPGSGTWRSPI